MLEVMAETGELPEPYYDVHAAAIPKKEKGVRPLDFRLLAIFVALYRVEMGAWFDRIFPELAQRIHCDVFGTAAGKEATEIAWDAQAHVELADARGEQIVISTYDYYKYFDSFDHDFAKGLMLRHGVPVRLVNLVHSMLQTSVRTIRQAGVLGEPFHAHNGLGQGDVMSLIPAFLLVSWQFKMLDSRHPQVQKGAYIDDRNFRGSLTQLLAVHRTICEFDEMAGHLLQHDKTAFIANRKDDIAKIRKLSLNGYTPKSGNIMTLVGDTIASAVGRIVAPVDDRVKKAMDTAGKIAHLSTNIARRTRVAVATVIPTAVYGTQGVKATAKENGKLVAKMLQIVWGAGKRMRCAEIVIGILNDPPKSTPRMHRPCEPS